MKTTLINKIILFLFMELSLLGCMHRADNISVIEESMNGVKISRGEFINDKIKHGWFVTFYSDGSVKDSIHFKMGKWDGWHIHYKPDGILKSKIQGKNGLQDGVTYSYFDNGRVEEMSHWFNDKVYGDVMGYYPNGNLRIYNVFDYYQKNMYVLKYDESGKRIKEEGVVISPQFIAYYASDSLTPILAQSVWEGEEIIIRGTAARPPGTQTIVYVGEYGKHNKISKLRQIPIINNTFTFRKTFMDQDEFDWIVIGEIKYKNGLVKRDTVYPAIKITK